MSAKEATQWRPSWAETDWWPFGLEVAPFVVPILIQRAREGRTITYGELAAELERRYSIRERFRKNIYGSPIGLVGHKIQELGEAWGVMLPPINVIVVNKGKKVAGEGADPLLRDYFNAKGRRFSKRDRRALHSEACRVVFDYGERWIAVAEAFGAPILKPASGRIAGKKPLKLPKVVHGNGEESSEHKALKRWVKNHPGLFSDFGTFTKGTEENVISSGDRLDVHFGTWRQRLAVEVKPSHASTNELQRGVFQVVKYRAVLRAEQRAMQLIPNADAVLVTTNPPDAETRALMRLLHVEHRLAPKHAEDD